MAEIKVSQLQVAPSTLSTDRFMIVQNGVNKSLTLQTLLSNLNSQVVVNSEQIGLDFTINGLDQPNLFYTKASINSIGIRNFYPTAPLHVIGNVKVGGYGYSTQRRITSVAISANNTPAGYQTVTVNLDQSEISIVGIFTTTDPVGLMGCAADNITSLTDNQKDVLNSLHTISGIAPHSFTFTVTTGSLPPNVTITQSKATAIRHINSGGLYISSIDHFPDNYNNGSNLTINSQYHTTGITISATENGFTLSAGVEGQEKIIYMEQATNNATAKITIPTGQGFNTVQLSSTGHSITLVNTASKWICKSAYGATLTTV